MLVHVLAQQACKQFDQVLFGSHCTSIIALHGFCLTVSTWRIIACSAQVLEGESAQLRAELGLDPPSGPLPEEAPRFSKRARQMAPETEMENDAAVYLQEAHAAHLRCVTTFT